MQSTKVDIQLLKSEHETKSEIQQKTGMHIDKAVNNKNEIRFHEWPRTCFPRFPGNYFLKGNSS